MGNPNNDSCMPEFNVTKGGLYAPAEWKPLAPENFNVKLIVAADVRKSQEVALMVTKAQEYLSHQFKEELADTKLMMNVETFQDDCRHSTGWSSEPKNISSTSTRWHCFQTNTRFSESFDEMSREQHKINVLIIIGNRFDDNLNKSVEAVKNLHELHGTRVFAIPTSTEHRVNESYKALSAAGNGLYLPGVSGDIKPAIEEIAQSILAHEVGISEFELPVPATPQLKEVRRLLLNS